MIHLFLRIIRDREKTTTQIRDCSQGNKSIAPIVQFLDYGPRRSALVVDVLGLVYENIS